MLTLSFLTGLTSLLDFLWMVRATPWSAVHVQSLLITNDNVSIKGILDNQVSGTAIHAMIRAHVLFSAPNTILS